MEGPSERPGAGGAPRWLWPVLVVAAAAVAIPLTRTEPFGTRGADPTARPAQALAVPSIDPSDFVSASLDPPAVATWLAGDGPLLPDAPDVTVVTIDEEELRTVDIATGDVGRWSLTMGSDTLDPWTLFAVGDSLITQVGQNVVRLTDQENQPVRLARGHVALPTVDDASVWVFKDHRRSGSLMRERAATVVRVRLDGTVTDRIAVPQVAQPVAGIRDGVLLSTPSGIHIASRGGVRRIVASGQLVAAGVDRLACLVCDADLSCQIAIGTLADPDRVRVAIARSELPGGSRGLGLGRFSPDGRRLAVPLLRFDAGPEVAQTSVVIIDTTTGVEVSRIPVPPAQAFEATPFDWSPDGRLLFVGLGTSLSAWDADDGGLRRVAVGRVPIRGLAVIETSTNRDSGLW